MRTFLTQFKGEESWKFANLLASCGAALKLLEKPNCQLGKLSRKLTSCSEKLRYRLTKGDLETDEFNGTSQ